MRPIRADGSFIRRERVIIEFYYSRTLESDTIAAALAAADPPNCGVQTAG
jgi:hypothetical protein